MNSDIKSDVKVRFSTILEGEEGQRIDNYLLRQLKGVPKSMIYRIIRKGEVRVNKGRVKPEYKIQVDDIVRIPPVRVSEDKGEVSAKLRDVAKLEHCILYEDDQLLVINKQSGIAVHGGSGLKFGVIEGFRALRPDAKDLELVHRIDRDTSGVLLIAKKRSALRSLHEQLRNKTVDKRYWCLVNGNWSPRWKKVDQPLLKNELQSGERIVRVNSEGKPSLTKFKLITSFSDCSLIEASPVTGRTHQIRVHTFYHQAPILGDTKYFDEDSKETTSNLGLDRLFLHARSISFVHPKTEQTMYIEAPIDKSLKRTLAKLEKDK